MTPVRVVLVFGGPEPLPRFVAGSIGVHLLGVILMLIVPGWLEARRPRPLPTLDVVLAAPLDAGRQPEAKPAAKAPAPTPPAPKQVETKPPEGASATPIEPPKPKPELPKPDPTPVKKPEKKPEPTPPPAPVTGPADGGGPELDGPVDAGENAGPVAGTSGGVALAGMGAEFDWYRDAVMRALFAAWRQPVAGRNRESIEVSIAFEIQRDGTVRGIRIESPSGDTRLDRSAYRAVQNAALPPLPRNHGSATQAALFVFRLEPDAF